MADLSRRGLLAGLGFLACAPAIVRVSSLMKLPPPVRPELFVPNSGYKIGDMISFYSILEDRYVEFKVTGYGDNKLMFHPDGLRIGKQLYIGTPMLGGSLAS